MKVFDSVSYRERFEDRGWRGKCGFDDLNSVEGDSFSAVERGSSVKVDLIILNV